MKLDKIEELLQKYDDGETTVAEEQQLKTFFREHKELPHHLQAYAAQFSYYAQQQEEQLPKNLSEEWLFLKIEPAQQQQVAPAKGRQLFWPQLNNSSYFKIAAGVALLLGAFWFGSRYGLQRMAAPTTANTEVAALRREVEELKQVLAADASASERIRVVSQEFSPEQDQELVAILVQTMNSDANVNVRLAACEALSKFGTSPQVRAALVKSLPQQTDPLMQLILIDLLVQLQEKKAVDHLQQLVQQQETLPIVKNKAEEGIGILL